jgi:hypothetical protein
MDMLSSMHVDSAREDQRKGCGAGFHGNQGVEYASRGISTLAGYFGMSYGEIYMTQIVLYTHSQKSIRQS